MRRIFVTLFPIPLLVLGGLAGGALAQSPGPSTTQAPIRTLDEPATKPVTCPPSGTYVPLGQMMHPSFAADFVGCHARAKALFWSPTTPTPSTTADPNVVVFQVTLPATSGQQGTYYPVKIAKSQAGLIFQLKQGEPVVLTGGTEGSNPVLFVADSLERDRAVVAELDAPSRPIQPVQQAPAGVSAPAPDRTAHPVSAPASEPKRDWRGAFYGYFMSVPGIAGQFSNKTAGATPVSSGMTLTLGRKVQYNLSLGFMHFGQANGVDLDAATLTIPIPVYDGAVRLCVEPIIQLVEWNLLASSTWLMTWQSGVGVQFTVGKGKFFGVFSPFNAQIRYLAMDTQTIKAAFGLNWPVKLGAGLRF